MIDIDLPLVLGVVARTTAVLLLALGATTLLRRASAATRHLVWTVALGGVLVLPFLGRFVPEWRVVPVPVELAPVAAAAVEPVVMDHEPAEVVHESAPAVPQAPRTDWMMWIVGLWAAGGAVLLLRLAYGVLRIWWVERRSAELADAGWTSLTDGLARRLRIGRMVTLLRGEHASVPMTWGIVRPVVLLPAEADGWSEERRTVVLAHELAHIRRWDALTQWIAHLAVAVHWYNPLVWAAARRLRQEREQACDDAVLAMGARPTEYADHLLDIVRSLGTASGPPPRWRWRAAPSSRGASSPSWTPPCRAPAWAAPSRSPRWRAAPCSSFRWPRSARASPPRPSTRWPPRRRPRSPA